VKLIDTMLLIEDKYFKVLFNKSAQGLGYVMFLPYMSYTFMELYFLVKKNYVPTKVREDVTDLVDYLLYIRD
jgi:hypothetical protein